MATQISPMLAVTDGNAAIEFYKAAVGAQLFWELGEGPDVVAGFCIDGAHHPSSPIRPRIHPANGGGSWNNGT